MFGLSKKEKEQEKFRNLMIKMNLKGFELMEHSKINNGHVLRVAIPPTSNFSEFEKRKGNFEKWYKAIIEIEDSRFSRCLEMKVITKDIGNYEFEPVKYKPCFIYIGKTFDGKPYFIDLNKDAHVLIAGVTGTGKSYLLATMLVNLIYHHSKLYEIYLCQTAKRDIDYLAECPGVKATLYTATETNNVLERALKEMDRRYKLFAKYGIKGGIDSYNEVAINKLKRQVYAFEEISLYMPDETDDETEAIAKAKVWKNIWKIVKLGREAGIHFMGLTQRTTAANLGGSGEIKSQLCRITFRQAQAIDSTNVIDCDLATKLKERECYVLSADGLKLIKAPSTDKKMTLLKKFVPEIKVLEKESLEEIEIDETDDIELDQVEEPTQLETPQFQSSPVEKTKAKTPKPKKNKKGAEADVDSKGQTVIDLFGKE